MKDKRPFIANIFDLQLTKNYKEVDKSTKQLVGGFLPLDKGEKNKTKKVFDYSTKKFSNERWAIYCSCGCKNEYSYDILLYRHSFDTLQIPVCCYSCGRVYKSLENIQIIQGYKNISQNVISKRFSVVEKDNFFALYSFVTIVFVSATTQKLVFKDFGNHSLYLSKKGKILRTKNGDKIITVPLKRLVKYCNSVVDHLISNSFDVNIISEGMFQSKIINPLIKFCNIIESKCDKRDVEKIIGVLEKEREIIYYTSFFCLSYQSKQYGFNLIRQTWIDFLKKRLSIVLAIYLYPPLATIVINYGPNAVLKLLQDTSLMCTLTDLIRRKPTNPKHIFEVMFKAKISSENHKSKKIAKYIESENAKIKRKIIKNPADKLIKDKIIIHPTLIRDYRIPVSDDFKLKLKNIIFKKNYIDLFLHNFDGTAIVFYGIINGSSIFESFEDFNECIENHPREEIIEVADYLQMNYDRRNLNGVKLDLKNLQHILKINFISKNQKKENEKKPIPSIGSIIQVYMDTIRMLSHMEMDISDVLKYKNYEELRNAHTAISQSYRLRLDKKSSEELKKHLSGYRETERTIDGIKFELLDTAEKFYEESKVMNHCVKSYCKQTSEGQFIIYSIEDIETNERATLSINKRKQNNSFLPILGELETIGAQINQYSFNQLKAKNNQRASAKLINAARKLCSDFFGLKNIESHDLTPINAISELASLELAPVPVMNIGQVHLDENLGDLFFEI